MDPPRALTARSRPKSLGMPALSADFRRSRGGSTVSTSIPSTIEGVRDRLQSVEIRSPRCVARTILAAVKFINSAVIALYLIRDSKPRIYWGASQDFLSRGQFLRSSPVVGSHLTLAKETGSYFHFQPGRRALNTVERIYCFPWVPPLKTPIRGKTWIVSSGTSHLPQLARDTPLLVHPFGQCSRWRAQYRQ